jgi:poly(A) polymerase
MQSVSAALDQLSSLAASQPVSVLANVFSAAGYELALVGGPVRDAFLGRPAVDLDFTTNATPEQILDVIAPVVDAQWEIGRAFGTIGARVRGEQVEITTYRADSYDGVTRKPEVVFGETLDGDLVRRDFTVNAMALRVPSVTLVDPAGGIDDLLAKILRTPSAAHVSFGDDPLRMMRAARFSSQLGFTVADDTRAAMEHLADRIEIVSAERIRDELSKLLLTDNPRSGLDLLVDTGLAHHVIPELPALQIEADEHHRHKDIYQHSLTVLDQAIGYEKSRHPGDPPDLIVRLASLLHDIGKPATRRYESGGVVSFHHHDVVGAKLAKKRLRALRFDNDTIAAVTRLIELHLRFFGYSEGVWTDAAVRRYVRDAGEQLERLHILTRSDVTTRNRRKADRLGFAYANLEDRITILEAEEEMRAIRPDLDGEQIMAILGIKPGPEVGEAYRYLLELRLDEGSLGEEEAQQRLRAWWASR